MPEGSFDPPDNFVDPRNPDPSDIRQKSALVVAYFRLQVSFFEKAGADALGYIYQKGGDELDAITELIGPTRVEQLVDFVVSDRDMVAAFPCADGRLRRAAAERNVRLLQICDSLTMVAMWSCLGNELERQ